MEPQVETRFVPLTVAALELEECEEGSLPRITGHAAVFDTLSREMFGFREKIAPGAFKRSLAEGADVVALVNHDRNLLLGRTPDTLTIWEDKTGLAVEINTAPTQIGKDTVISLRRGDLRGMSFAFIVRDEKIEGDEVQIVRTIKDLDLIDVSVVTSPAYEETDVTVAKRSVDSWLQARQSPAESDEEKAEAARLRTAHRERLTAANEKTVSIG